jgi:hypothetical protein
MCAFDDPVDLIVHMFEKARAVALLKTIEDPSDVVFGYHKHLLNLCEQPVARRWLGRIVLAPKSGDARLIGPIYDTGLYDLFWR